jgi:hypothetical protein
LIGSFSFAASSLIWSIGEPSSGGDAEINQDAKRMLAAFRKFHTWTFGFFILSSSHASPFASQVTIQPIGGGMFASFLFGLAVFQA